MRYKTLVAHSSLRWWHRALIVSENSEVLTGYTSTLRRWSVTLADWPQNTQWFSKLNWLSTERSCLSDTVELCEVFSTKLNAFRIDKFLSTINVYSCLRLQHAHQKNEKRWHYWYLRHPLIELLLYCSDLYQTRKHKYCSGRVDPCQPTLEYNWRMIEWQ